MVTGPSLVSETCMSVPNLPVAQFFCMAASALLTKLSYKGIAILGGAAFVKEGRLPFLVLA